MKKLTIVLIGLYVIECHARIPIKPKVGSIPFLVYFKSYYRGICQGMLVSRVAVLTAAVCVLDPIVPEREDTRPINVVMGSPYRHARRGVRNQVTRILAPKISSNITGFRGYILQNSVALLLLRRKVPDILMEVPARPMALDYKNTLQLRLHQECLIAGWHFFYKGDKIFKGNKYLLQRNLRVQFLTIVHNSKWCETLEVKFEKILSVGGFTGYFDKNAYVCIRDPDETAQECHGMYGAPLICQGWAVGMLMAPDAQWSHCKGNSNIVHMFNTEFLKKFFKCVSHVFTRFSPVDWEAFKKSIYDDMGDDYDYVDEMYDKILSGSSESSPEYAPNPQKKGD